jgi:hypothetical protein
MTKEIEIAIDLQNIFNEYASLISLRDVYTKRLFGYKKAAKAAKQAESVRVKFWRMVSDCYTYEVRGKGLKYDQMSGILTIKEVNEND